MQTRAEILERAVDKIKTLKDENEQLKAKIDNLPHVQPGERLCKSYDGHVTFYFRIVCFAFHQARRQSCMVNSQSRLQSFWHSKHSSSS